MDEYMGDKEDNHVFKCTIVYENASVNYLLANREIARYNIEKCIKEKDFERLAKFWKEENIIDYFLKKRGYQEKKETDSLTERIIEGKSELIDEFIRKAKEIISKEKR